MKKKQLTTLLTIILLTIEIGYSQVVLYQAIPFNTTVTTVINTDATTTGVLNATNGFITTRNISNGAMNTELGLIAAEEKLLLNKKYKKNKYDKSGGDLLKLAGTVAAGFGSKIATNKLDKGYYITKNKRDKMKALNMDKILLMSLFNVDKKKITSANRQEIYRLRGEVLRQFSRNDKVVAALLLLPAAAFAMENRSELLSAIKALEITL